MDPLLWILENDLVTIVIAIIIGIGLFLRLEDLISKLIGKKGEADEDTVESTNATSQADLGEVYAFVEMQMRLHKLEEEIDDLQQFHPDTHEQTPD